MRYIDIVWQTDRILSIAGKCYLVTTAGESIVVHNEAELGFVVALLGEEAIVEVRNNPKLTFRYAMAKLKPIVEIPVEVTRIKNATSVAYWVVIGAVYGFIGTAAVYAIVHSNTADTIANLINK